MLPTFNLLVALACEAKPLIDYYRLRKHQATSFPWFTKAASQPGEMHVNLVVSGVGQINMAAACGWLGAHTRDSPSAWLNVGIAGHAALPVGEIVRIVQCREVGAERSHYPPLVVKWPGKTASLLSYGTPCADYPTTQAVDMEASAFFAIAQRFCSSEMVQSVKIISDNCESGMQRLPANRISEMIAERIPLIADFASSMAVLLPMSSRTSLPEADIERLHCTVSQLQQYRDLVNKLANIGVAEGVVREKSRTAISMQELLTELRSMQQQTAPKPGCSPGAS